MATRALNKLTSQGAHLAKELTALSGWAVPGALVAGWMVWPGLTESFKEEALGIKATPAPGFAPAAAAPSKGPVFPSSGKYKFVRNEIGERPTLEEE
ncbi:hypothetical protein Poli38472_000225 [Pythium oligandrum]|uniref:Uncharacterized protein n=1 Tax=Pythium oligandrum TaxID=41045 RepID=A0A8K1CBY1_PYTOL|nr:hypothetical protein Poli38472_000225 [Pythium oligandrum]|eukprot:TMW60183.1 hypothetical protein Poli38472_000225 [Pythium oligandrum]